MPFSPQGDYYCVETNGPGTEVCTYRNNTVGAAWDAMLEALRRNLERRKLPSPGFVSIVNAYAARRATELTGKPLIAEDLARDADSLPGLFEQAGNWQPVNWSLNLGGQTQPPPSEQTPNQTPAPPFDAVVACRAKGGQYVYGNGWSCEMPQEPAPDEHLPPSDTDDSRFRRTATRPVYDPYVQTPTTMEKVLPWAIGAGALLILLKLAR